MIIESIHIHSFGTLRSFDAEFSRGLNIIEGENESGKTAVAMFIKFIFFGLSGRASDSGLSERKKFVNWDTGEASGSLTLSSKMGRFRIERTLIVSSRGEELAKENVREILKIVDAETNMPVMKGQSPAEVFLGISEDVFVNTVFVRQLSDTKINGSDVKSAIENILCSADANINTEKAVEKLDKARKVLLYKNGNGGEIFDLRAKRAELTAALAEAQSHGADTLETEASLAESKKTLERMKSETAELDAITKAYRIISTKRKFDAKQAAEIKLTELAKKAEANSTSPASNEFYNDIVENSTELKNTVLKISETEKAIDACKHALDAYETLSLGEEDGDESPAEYARKYESRKRGSVIAAVILGFFAVLAAVAAYIAWTKPELPTAVFAAVAAAAAAVLIGAVISVSVAVSSARSLSGLLAEWDCENTGDIEDAITEYNRKAKEKRALEARLAELEAELDTATGDKRILLTRLKTMCTSLGVSSALDTDGMIKEALTICAEITKERSDARREYDTVSGRLALLTEQLSGTDKSKLEAEYAKAVSTEEGKKALAMTPSAASDAERERAFKDGALRSQTERTHALETKLSALRVTSPDPAVILSQLEETNEKLASLEKTHAAYVLAMEALGEATENLRSGVLPRITHRACEIMSRLSSGRYQTVGVGSSFDMSFSRYGMTREIEYLSAGTRDIAYISLRIALIETLFDGDTAPSVFDESFARIDEGRMTSLLGLLAESDSLQSLVFTCRTLEGQIASMIPEAKKTVISRDSTR